VAHIQIDGPAPKVAPKAQNAADFARSQTSHEAQISVVFEGKQIQRFPKSVC